MIDNVILVLHLSILLVLQSSVSPGSVLTEQLHTPVVIAKGLATKSQTLHYHHRQQQLHCILVLKLSIINSLNCTCQTTGRIKIIHLNFHCSLTF
jgi:hypothetical protein